MFGVLSGLGGACPGMIGVKQQGGKNNEQERDAGVDGIAEMTQGR